MHQHLIFHQLPNVQPRAVAVARVVSAPRSFVKAPTPPNDAPNPPAPVNFGRGREPSFSRRLAVPALFLRVVLRPCENLCDMPDESRDERAVFRTASDEHRKAYKLQRPPLNTPSISSLPTPDSAVR